jgi:hypothetical protein
VEFKIFSTPDDIIKELLDHNSAILIVDDEPFNILAFKIIFKRFD